jgi:DNA-binding winged helix-turn-helix (wHTH) protein
MVRRAFGRISLCAAVTLVAFKPIPWLSLAARQGEAVARIELLNDMWGLKYDLGGNVVDAVIAKLRKKLGDQARVIETIHGHGYLYRNPALDSGSVVKASVPRQFERKARPERVSSR